MKVKRFTEQCGEVRATCEIVFGAELGGPVIVWAAPEGTTSMGSLHAAINAQQQHATTSSANGGPKLPHARKMDGSSASSCGLMSCGSTASDTANSEIAERLAIASGIPQLFVSCSALVDSGAFDQRAMCQVERRILKELKAQ